MIVTKPAGVNCGFLCKRREGENAESVIYTATRYDREMGTFQYQSGWPNGQDMHTQPECYRNVAHLSKELVDELAKAEPDVIVLGPRTTLENYYTSVVIERNRGCNGCKSWYPWTEHSSPKEHLEELKVQQLEDNRRRFESELAELSRQERKRTNWIMIGLAIGALIFAAMEVYAALASINPKHWLFNWLR